MASSVPTWRGTGPEGFVGAVDRPSRKEFVHGVNTGGLMVGAIAAAAILSRVSGRGPRRRRR